MMQKEIGNLTKGLFFILSAPSGAGKTTLIRMLTQKYKNIIESVSYTTREPREKEIEGKDYFFITQKKFEEKIKNGDFLEYEKVFGHYYGTSKEIVEKNLKEKKHVVLVIDTKGALSLKNKVDAIYIFLSPPSIEELKKRIIKRGSISETNIEKRLEIAKEEMEVIDKYDYNVVNIDLDTSYEVLKAIFIAEEHKIKNFKYWRKS